MPTFVEGGRVVLGDKEFVVAKAKLKTVMALEDVQKVVAAGEVGMTVGLAGILLLLLKPAQPDLVLEELLELDGVDGDALATAVKQAYAAAGFRQAASGEAPSP